MNFSEFLCEGRLSGAQGENVTIYIKKIHHSFINFLSDINFIMDQVALINQLPQIIFKLFKKL